MGCDPSQGFFWKEYSTWLKMGLQRIYFKKCERITKMIFSPLKQGPLELINFDLIGVMLWTCKSLDSRVHNYWIHYVSLCILLKLGYMMCGSILWCELKICSVTSWYFSEPHVFFSGIKTLLIIQDWLALIWRVRVQSKYFTKINFERNIFLFQDNNKTKNKA